MVRALGHACGEWGTSEYEARCDLRALAAHAGTALLVRAPHARRWVGKRARFEGASVPVLSIAGESTIVPLASTGRQSRGASGRARDMALRPTARSAACGSPDCVTGAFLETSETAVSGEVSTRQGDVGSREVSSQEDRPLSQQARLGPSHDTQSIAHVSRTRTHRAPQTPSRRRCCLARAGAPPCATALSSSPPVVARSSHRGHVATPRRWATTWN